jgi:hypothetical protein
MKKITHDLLLHSGLLLLFCLIFHVSLFAQSVTLKNEVYRLSPGKGGAFTVENKDGAASTFQPVFTILYRAANPGLWRYQDSSSNLVVPRWNYLDRKGTTIVQYEAAKVIRVRAGSYKMDGNGIVWLFPPDSLFQLSATVELEQGTGEPKISFSFSPRKEGWFSVGYAGAPEINPEKAESIWQPLVWQERRFPALAILSMEHMCPLPAVMVGEKGSITSLVADPSEVPFRLPTFDNSGFGVSVRNEKGNAQPEIFAPVFGQSSSKMKAGDGYHFSFRLLSRKGSWLDAYRYIAESIYHFHDYRSNGTVSLNETLENMIDLAMNDVYSGWNKDLKAFDYTTDVKGTVKLVSALHPLSLALITDNPEIYARRALPMIEYLMSREKFLFAISEGETSQSPSHRMNGPAAGVAELASLYNMSKERSPVFAHYANVLYDKRRSLNLGQVLEPGRWQDALAIYRMTRDRRYLDKAVEKASAYVARRIDTTQTDFSDAHLGGKGRSLNDGGQFWVDFSPQWMDLLELYEETHNKRFLDAALYGARIYTSYVWLQPAVPAGEVLINGKGVLGMDASFNKTNPQPMAAMPQKVPAWRVSQIGLTPEASNTYINNPAVFLTNYAAYMMRLAFYTGDRFLRDIARSAVVGRYANYPGYDINVEYTTLYQRPDYPLRNYNDLTYNQFYYNHIWPQIALLTDFLVADALDRSGGRISFPSQNAEGYAYLHSKVYGDRPGKFYEDTGVQLWMPKGLLRTDNIQVNYVSGRGNDNIYLSLLNQADSSVRVKLVFNPDVLPIDLQQRYAVRVWKDNRPSAPASLSNGELTIDVSPKGITALCLESIPVKTRFQGLVSDTSVRPLSENSFSELPTAYGKVTGMLISMGRTLSSGYIWLEAGEKVLRRARLRYRTGNDWKEIVDAAYPYEFSIPLADGDRNIECKIDGETPDGTTVGLGSLLLKK